MKLSQLLYFLIVIFCVIGWIMNIGKLVACDFEGPYKAEIIRTVGVFAFPAGIVIGYMTIEDK